MKSLKKIALILTLVLGVTAFVNAQTKTVVKVADLKKNITDSIAKNYPGYTIKDAFKVNKNKVITYTVDVVKDKNVTTLSYDKTGKFLKVIEPKSTKPKTTTNPKTNTNTTPKTSTTNAPKTNTNTNTKPK